MKHWGMEIKVCANQEAGPFWGPERGYNKGNFGWTRRFKFVEIKFLGS